MLVLSSSPHCSLSYPTRHATHKAGGVVISQCLGIAESLHGRVGFDDLILQGALG